MVSVYYQADERPGPCFKAKALGTETSLKRSHGRYVHFNRVYETSIFSVLFLVDSQALRRHCNIVQMNFFPLEHVSYHLDKQLKSCTSLPRLLLLKSGQGGENVGCECLFTLRKLYSISALKKWHVKLHVNIVLKRESYVMCETECPVLLTTK